MGDKWSRILPKVATSTSLLGSFTCRNFTTWDRRLYFPSEGRRTEDFFARKIRRLRPENKSNVNVISQISSGYGLPLWQPSVNRKVDPSIVRNELKLLQLLRTFFCFIVIFFFRFIAALQSLC